MPNADDSVEFEPIDIPKGNGSKAKEEIEQLENRAFDAPPNSVHLYLGKFGHVKWHADSSAPLFCFVSICALLVFGLLIALVSTLRGGATWPDEVFKFLGQAILTLIGAVVGASATSVSAARQRRR
jgi:hypothetical protein